MTQELVHAMDHEHYREELAEALRHCRAGLKALEAAESASAASGSIYPTHIYLAATELASAIELSMKVALRNQ